MSNTPNSDLPPPPIARVTLLYHFCRMQLPGVQLSRASFDEQLTRTFALAVRVTAKNKGEILTWPAYFARLHAADWYLCGGVLANQRPAWDALFAARTDQSGRLLVESLRTRAAYFYPRNLTRQEELVQDFWGNLILPSPSGRQPILRRYDGLRPLVPWLITVFHNEAMPSANRRGIVLGVEDEEILPGEEVLPMAGGAGRWNEAFRDAAREWLAGLDDRQAMVLGMRWRMGLSQRQIAEQLGIHEGNVTRQIDRIAEQALAEIGQHLDRQGWMGDDLLPLLLAELAPLLNEESRFHPDRLAVYLREYRSKKRGAAQASM